MGFQLLRGDHLNEKPRPGDTIPRELIRCWEEHYTDENGKDKVRKISLMLPSEVPQFRTVFFNRCMELYNMWRMFKQSPPLGQGWANERGVTCKILQVLEVENNKYDAWQREIEDAKRKK